MNIQITQTKKMSRSQQRAQARICSLCGGYDAYGDDTGFPVFFAHLPGRPFPAGFLSGCHIPADPQNPETVEVSAAVMPEMRRKGVFKALLEKAAREAAELFPAATLTGPLPDYLSDSQLSRDYLYDELLMRCVSPGILPDNALPEGVSFCKVRQPGESGSIDTETAWSLLSGSQTAARLALTGGGKFYCVSHVEVPEALRRRGYGTVLLTHVLCSLPAGSDVVLQVRSVNKPALRLYQKTGFEITDKLSFYRFDRLMAPAVMTPR